MNLLQDRSARESAIRLDFLNHVSAGTNEYGRETIRVMNGRFLRDGKVGATVVVEN